MPVQGASLENGATLTRFRALQLCASGSAGASQQCRTILATTHRTPALMAGALFNNVMEKIVSNQCERHAHLSLTGADVVEIVDAVSSRFHRVQQPCPSKLLNLQIRVRLAHLCPRRIPAVTQSRPFSALFVSKQMVRSCCVLLKSIELLEFCVYDFIYTAAALGVVCSPTQN
jgi:hypothetical protein